MLHVDIPSRTQIERLITRREPACVSIYLPTTPVTPDAQADRIAFKNLTRDALGQLADQGIDKKTIDAIGEHFDELADDDDLWANQARSLAVFATAARIQHYRLANRLVAMAQVADRFHIKPLLRAVTGSQNAFVLALAQGSVRLIQVTAGLPAEPVRVPNLPRDISSAVGVASVHGRAAHGRIQGSEGQKVRLTQYARAVDNALRSVLHGRETPLILAAASPLDTIFQSVCTYSHVTQSVISGNPETISDGELAEKARAVLDELHAGQVAEFGELFRARVSQGRATTDIRQAAKAATFGAVDTLAVDIDDIVPGTISEEDGTVTLADEPGADSHGIVDEIAGRALLSGARILALRRDDIPEGGSLAAILRYPIQ